jgi:hypothetical protein
VTADRSTVENWVRRMEKAADEHDGSGTYRAFTFREVIAAAWADGHGRGYDDCRDDISRAASAARRAAREAGSTPPTPEESP